MWNAAGPLINFSVSPEIWLDRRSSWRFVSRRSYRSRLRVLTITFGSLEDQACYVFTVTKAHSNGCLVSPASFVSSAFSGSVGSAIAVANQHVSYRSVRPIGTRIRSREAHFGTSGGAKSKRLITENGLTKS